MRKKSITKPYPALLNHQYNVVFTGLDRDYIGLSLKGVLLTLATLGIYNFWKVAEQRRYLWRHTFFLGQPFAYTGKPTHGLKLACTASLGMTILGGFLYTLWSYETPYLIHGTLACLSVALPMVPVWSFQHFRYLVENTTWADKPLKLTTTTTGYAAAWLSGADLSLITLGLYIPYWRNHMFGLRVAGIQCEGLEVIYTGEVKNLWEDYVSALPAIVVTGGVYYFWLNSKVQKYRIANIWLGGDRVGSVRGFLQMHGDDYLFLSCLTLIVTVASCGILTPWLTIHKWRFSTSAFAFVGNLDLDKIPSPERHTDAA